MQSETFMETEQISFPSGETVQVQKRAFVFNRWTGAPVDTYGGKPVIELGGEPLFAELTLLRHFQKEGYDGVWVDTYRNRFRRSMSEESVKLPQSIRELYNQIMAANGRRRGWWDVMAWKEGELVFAESKWQGQDHILPAQKTWLKAALSTDLRLNSFVICEWRF